MSTRPHPETPIGLAFVTAFAVGAVVGTALVVIPVACWVAVDWAHQKVKKTLR